MHDFTACTPLYQTPRGLGRFGFPGGSFLYTNHRSQFSLHYTTCTHAHLYTSTRVHTATEPSAANLIWAALALHVRWCLSEMPANSWCLLGSLVDFNPAPYSQRQSLPWKETTPGVGLDCGLLGWNCPCLPAPPLLGLCNARVCVLWCPWSVGSYETPLPEHPPSLYHVCTNVILY